MTRLSAAKSVRAAVRFTPAGDRLQHEENAAQSTGLPFRGSPVMPTFGRAARATGARRSGF
jgi:hypothetical protein